MNMPKCHDMKSRCAALSTGGEEALVVDAVSAAATEAECAVKNSKAKQAVPILASQVTARLKAIAAGPSRTRVNFC